jgi:hypothetical protein
MRVAQGAPGAMFCAPSRGLDRSANALIGSTAADIPRHAFANLFICRFGCLAEQRNRLHVLARLTVAALRNVVLNPRLLNGMEAVCSDAFNGCDIGACHGAHRRDAGANGFAVVVHGTSAAERYAASKLGSREHENIAEIPEQTHLRVADEGSIDPVYLQLNHENLTLIRSGLVGFSPRSATRNPRRSVVCVPSGLP